MNYAICTCNGKENEGEKKMNRKPEGISEFIHNTGLHIPTKMELHTYNKSIVENWPETRKLEKEQEIKRKGIEAESTIKTKNAKIYKKQKFKFSTFKR